MYTWEKLVLENFFTEEKMLILIPYFCKCVKEHNLNQKLDVISHTVIVFLTCPLQLVVSQYSISLFCAIPQLSLPFHMLDSDQKNAIIKICGLSHEYNMLNGCATFRRSAEKITAPVAATLQALCRKVIESKKFSDFAVCNIVLQRVQGYIPITSNIQKELNQWIEGFLSNPQLLATL